MFLSNLTLVILIRPPCGSRIFNIITASWWIRLPAYDRRLFAQGASYLLRGQLLLGDGALAQVGLYVPACVPGSEPHIRSAGSRRQLLSLYWHPLLLLGDFLGFILHYVYNNCYLFANLMCKNISK